MNQPTPPSSASPVSPAAHEAVRRADAGHVTPSVFARELASKLGSLYAFHVVLNWSTRALDAGDIDDHRYYRGVALHIYRISLTSVIPSTSVEALLEGGKLRPSTPSPRGTDSLSEALGGSRGLMDADC